MERIGNNGNVNSNNEWLLNLAWRNQWYIDSESFLGLACKMDVELYNAFDFQLDGNHLGTGLVLVFSRNDIYQVNTVGQKRYIR
jgi:hypothetical protein